MSTTLDYIGLIDYLSQDDFSQYNISLANVIGLEQAVYFNELMNIFHKAVRKEKTFQVQNMDFNASMNSIDSEVYFEVDRDYIKSRTTLTKEKQLKFDATLEKLNLLKKDGGMGNRISIDLSVLISLFSKSNQPVVKKLKPETMGTGYVRNNSQADVIKLSLTHKNLTIQKKYMSWVDAVFANPKAIFLTTDAAKIFKKQVEAFTNGDEIALIEILDFAILRGYKEAQWCIDHYKQTHKINADVNKLSASYNVTSDSYRKERDFNIDD